MNYSDITNHIVAGPQTWIYAIPIVFFYGTLMISPQYIPQRSVHQWLFPIGASCLLYAWYQIGGVDVFGVSIALMGFVCFGYRDVRTSFKRIRPASTYGGKGDSKSTQVSWDDRLEEFPKSFGWKRVCWALIMTISLRFHGWIVGDKDHDAQQRLWWEALDNDQNGKDHNEQNQGTGSLKNCSSVSYDSPYSARKRWKREFGRNLKIVMLDLAFLDAVMLYIPYDAYFMQGGVAIDEPFPPQKLSPMAPQYPSLIHRLQHDRLPPRVVRTAVLGMLCFASISLGALMATLPALLLNAAGLLPDEYSPHAWPPIYGSFNAIYKRGLAGFWGTFWHQMTRQSMVTPGIALAKKLHLPRHSWMRYSCLVTSAFFFSGVMHTGVIPPRPLHAVDTPNQLRLAVAGFFWLQAPGMLLEDLISRLCRSLFRNCSSRPQIANCLRFVYAAVWLGLTLPLLVEPFRQVWFEHMLPHQISPLRALGDCIVQIKGY